MALLQQWVAAVGAHEPGQVDETVRRFAGLKPAQRSLLLELTGPFVTYLRDRNRSALGRLGANEAAAVEILVQRVSAAQKFSAWLHRAVMFETDVAVLAPEVTAEAMRDWHDKGVAEGVRAQDGEIETRNVLNWHWDFARDLVDAREPAVSDRFAAAWYHVVALYLLDHMFLGDLDPHLVKGLQIFPEDPRIQFDAACLADAFASRRVQAVLSGEQVRNFKLRIPNTRTTKTQAERGFARVLELAPDDAEARVRLARLRVEGGANEDALALLAVPIKRQVSRELEYMAHLIAGRANAALERVEAAASQFNAARQLFPSAQTPVIALSHLLLQAGDGERASALAASLGASAGPDARNDPWWSYFQATWLGEGALLDQLRDQVRR